MSESDNDIDVEKEKEFLENIQKEKVKITDRKESYRTAEVFTFLILTIVGFAFLISGLILSNKHPDYRLVSFAVTGAGTSILSVGLISLIITLFLRRKFIQLMTEIFGEVIQEKMPQRYKNLKKSGVLDAFMKLSSSRINYKLHNAEDCEIFIQKMWISNYDEFDDLIVDAIKTRNCTVRILLLDPNCKEAIEKRSKSLNGIRTPAEITHALQQNFNTIHNITRELNDEEKTRFTVRLYDSFIAVSMIGVGGEITLGLYLRKKRACMVRFYDA